LKNAVKDSTMFDLFFRYSKELGPIVKLDVPLVRKFVAGIFLGPSQVDIILINDSMAIRRILTDTTKFVTLKSFAEAGKALAGEANTIVSMGDVHKAKRKLLNGGFAPPQLREATKKVETLIQVLSGKLDRMIENGEGTDSSLFHNLNRTRN
jgi:cytochrome P450